MSPVVSRYFYSVIWGTMIMNERKKGLIIICMVTIFSLLLISDHLSRALGAAEDSLEVVAEGKFQAPAGTPENLARQIALFEAKKKAVESAGRYLAGKHLVLS